MDGGDLLCHWKHILRSSDMLDLRLAAKRPLIVWVVGVNVSDNLTLGRTFHGGNASAFLVALPAYIMGPVPRLLDQSAAT